MDELSPDNDTWREIHDALDGIYSGGRIHVKEDRPISVKISHTTEKKILVEFPKLIDTISFTPIQSYQLAKALLSHALACGLEKRLVMK